MSSASAEICIVYTALATLLRAPRNPKQHDLAALHQSMTRWGFTQPLALNEATGKLVEGHGRLDVLHALKAEGTTPPTRITVKGSAWFVPVVRGLSFPTDAEAYLMAANQRTIAGGWDEGLLGETLANLRDAHTSLDGLGFDQNQLDQLAASFAPAVQQVVATLPSVAPVEIAAPPVAPPVAPVLAESTILKFRLIGGGFGRKTATRTGDLTCVRSPFGISCLVFNVKEERPCSVPSWRPFGTICIMAAASRGARMPCLI